MKPNRSITAKNIVGAGAQWQKHNITGLAVFTLTLMLALGAGLCGCKSPGAEREVSATGGFAPPPPPSPSRQTDGTTEPSMASARLREGDSVKVAFEVETNLNTVAKIQIDGALILPLIGEVKVAGKTVQELQADLKERYKPLLVANELTVSIFQSSASVYVSGAVLRPGRIGMDRPLTALEAVMEAGGFDPNRARPSKVSVKRLENGRQVNYPVNLRKALDGDDPAPFQLKPFDIIFVPEKKFNF